MTADVQTITDKLAERRVSVSARAFAAAWQFVSTEETRYYLNGVLIEPHPAGGAILVATNGHTMGVIYDPKGAVSRSCICPMPGEAMRQIVSDLSPEAPEDDDDDEYAHARAQAPRYRREPGSVHFICNAFFVTDTHYTGTTEPFEIGATHIMAGYAEEIIGTFPDWRRVIPDPANLGKGSRVMHWCVEYLDRFTIAAQILRGDWFPNVNILSQVDAPALVRVRDRDDFLGVLMPMTAKDQPTGDEFMPAFLRR